MHEMIVIDVPDDGPGYVVVTPVDDGLEVSPVYETYDEAYRAQGAEMAHTGRAGCATLRAIDRRGDWEPQTQ